MDGLPKVLVVEDDDGIRKLLLMALRRQSLHVDAAADGAEALRLCAATEYAVIILDLMMPVVDGFEVARRLKSNPATASIPLVAISALARAGDREDALAAGCDEFVRKPFELDELERILRGYLDGA